MDIKVNSAFVSQELSNVFSGIREVNSTRSKEAIAKAVFTIATEEFIKDINNQALKRPSSFHHIYEWGRVGSTKDKLFKIKRSATSGGNLKITPYFINSRTRVPIPKELRVAGKSGKFVTKEFIFREKAQVMELGKPTKPFSAKKQGKALAFLGNNGKPFFIRYPRTTQIKNPGGKATTGSFFKAFEGWFRNPQKIQAAIAKSGYYKDLENSIAKTISRMPNNNISAVRSTVISVSNRYSKGVDFI